MFSSLLVGLGSVGVRPCSSSIVLLLTWSQFSSLYSWLSPYSLCSVEKILVAGLHFGSIRCGRSVVLPRARRIQCSPIITESRTGAIITVAPAFVRRFPHDVRIISGRVLHSELHFEVFIFVKIKYPQCLHECSSRGVRTCRSVTCSSV
jgi:hypothetical protein